MIGLSKRHRIEKRTARVARPILEGLDDRVLLSTFKVNTTSDTVAVNLKTGKDATGHISLRSAIQAANAKPNSETDPQAVPAPRRSSTAGNKRNCIMYGTHHWIEGI